MVGTGLGMLPVKGTASGLLEAMVSKALRVPAADGVNVTLTEQLPLGITVTPVQASELMAKSPAFAPLMVAARMIRLALPLLVTLTLCAALVVSRADENVRLGGDGTAVVEVKLATRLAALTVPIPVAKSQPVLGAEGWLIAATGINRQGGAGSTRSPASAEDAVGQGGVSAAGGGKADGDSRAPTWRCRSRLFRHPLLIVQVGAEV